MTVQIGDRKLATRMPTDLDRGLLADTGCNAAEIGRIIAGNPLAGTVARALLPFLAEDGRPSLAELAGEIEAAGTGAVAAQVVGLYVAAGADDLDGLTIAQLCEKAEAEQTDLAGLKRLNDILAAMRSARKARAAAKVEA
ncbi:MAG TPA: hypothetical protein VMS43_13930 [Allosphingosinicella sp.]|nr:hypothetical protein [Allosphingosinicella sp.]